MRKHRTALLLCGLALAIPVPALAMNNMATTVMVLSAAHSSSNTPSCEQRYAQCVRAQGGAADPVAAVERIQLEWAQDAQAAKEKRERFEREQAFEAQRKAEIKAQRDAERTDLEKQIADKWKDVKILRPN